MISSVLDGDQLVLHSIAVTTKISKSGKLRQVASGVDM